MLIRTTQRGFTLIELLVVTSIISLLSAVVIVGVANTRVKGYDAKFVQEMSSVRNALALYKSIHGTFPTPVASRSDTFSGDFDTSLSPLLADKLMPYIPHYYNWSQTGVGFNINNYVFVSYNPTVPSSGNLYHTDYTCGSSTVDYATWTPYTYPGALIFITDANHVFNLPKSYTYCTDDPAGAGTGCFVVPNYYCMSLY